MGFLMQFWLIGLKIAKLACIKITLFWLKILRNYKKTDKKYSKVGNPAMTLRNMKLEKLYAFKDKDSLSLKTYDIEGKL